MIQSARLFDGVMKRNRSWMNQLCRKPLYPLPVTLTDGQGYL
jgi:hypothetical protein